MISRPRGGSHDWVWQIPQSFEITVLDIIFLKWSLDHMEGHTTKYGKHLELQDHRIRIFIKHKVQTEF
jgi:hypothetical protein